MNDSDEALRTFKIINRALHRRIEAEIWASAAALASSVDPHMAVQVLHQRSTDLRQRSQDNEGLFTPRHAVPR